LSRTSPTTTPTLRDAEKLVVDALRGLVAELGDSLDLAR
jgi:hypothetical protein